MERKVVVLDLIRAFDLNFHEILYFKMIMEKRGLSSQNHVIVVANADDEIGKTLVKLLSEKNSDEQFHESESFFVRGLAERVGIQKKLNIMDTAMADKLLDIADIPVIVADKGTIDIFSI